jgi:hypothetical protein
MFTAPYEFRNKNWNYLYLKKINLITYSRLWLIKIGRYIHEIKISCFHFEMCMQVEKKLIYCKVLLLTIILSPYRLSRMGFFLSYLTDFSYFPLIFFHSENCRTQSEQVKNTFWKGVYVDGFNYFHWFSVTLFSIHNHLCIMD